MNDVVYYKSMINEFDFSSTDFVDVDVEEFKQKQLNDILLDIEKQEILFTVEEIYSTVELDNEKNTVKVMTVVTLWKEHED